MCDRDEDPSACPNCSFCGAAQHETAMLITSSVPGVAICGDCVEQCQNIVDFARRPQRRGTDGDEPATPVMVH